MKRFFMPVAKSSLALILLSTVAVVSAAPGNSIDLDSHRLFGLLDGSNACRAMPAQHSGALARQLESVRAVLDTEGGAAFFRGTLSGFRQADLVGRTEFGDRNTFMDYKKETAGFRMGFSTFLPLEDGSYATLCLAMIHTVADAPITPGNYRIVDLQQLGEVQEGDMLAALVMIKAGAEGGALMLGEGVIEKGQFTIHAIEDIRSMEDGRMDASIELSGRMRVAGREGDLFQLQAKTGGFSKWYPVPIPPLAELKGGSSSGDIIVETIQYYDYLKSCTPHTFSYPHPMVPGFTGRNIIHGKDGQHCIVSMAIPGNKEMKCNLTAKTVALMTSEAAYAEARAGQFAVSSGDPVSARLAKECTR